jgi:hypothetical protein
MAKQLTIEDINRVTEEVWAREAQANLDAGSQDPFDIFIVVYHKANPEQREKMMQALSEYDKH